MWVLAWDTWRTNSSSNSCRVFFWVQVTPYPGKNMLAVIFEWWYFRYFISGCFKRLLICQVRNSAIHVVLRLLWRTSANDSPCYITRLWFQMFFIFTPILGNDPIWLIFFKWVETTNQIMLPKIEEIGLQHFRSLLRIQLDPNTCVGAVGF